MVCMAMGRRTSGAGGGMVVVVVVLVVLANCVNAQVYTCWGGCYNECFLRSNKAWAERMGCYYPCLNSCVPRTASDYRYYCQIGCSLENCPPLRYGDGARMEKCFGRCRNLCEF